MKGWSASDVPTQEGRTAVVTGANSGLGYVTARELARRGARVVLACRSAERGTEALEDLRREVPDARVELRSLDLGSLASVRDFVTDCAAEHERVDLLVNNAGIMAVPYMLTTDGHESQFAVNHLGHFALTGGLMPLLLESPGARVVNVSSFVHALANIDINDLDSVHDYRKWIAYGRSKTANLLFTHELARRLARAGTSVVAAAAHPGYANTNLQTAGPRLEGRGRAERLARLGNRLFAQPAEAGALPVLFAATAPGVRPDSFTGPRLAMWRGAPAPSWRASWTLDDRAGERLWAESERMSGVRYSALDI